jgi:hypothetical protein
MASEKTDDTTTAAPVVEEAIEAPAGAAESYVAAIRAEYSQYVAVGPLHVDGVLAFAAGSPVPASHPQRPVWEADGSVRPA